MKPIGDKSRGQEYFSADSDKRNIATDGSSMITPTTVSARSARIEDLLAALPVQTMRSVAPTEDGQKDAAAPVAAVHHEFAQQLNTAVEACTNFEDAQAATAAVLQQLASIDFVGWFTIGGQRIGQAEHLEGLTISFDELPATRQQSLHAAATATSGGVKTIAIYEAEAGFLNCVVPVRGLIGQCLVTSSTAKSQQIDVSQRAAIELAVCRLSEWQAAAQRELVVRNSQHVAALIELIGKITACSSQNAMSHCLTKELQRYLNASEISFGLCHDKQFKCRLVAVSSAPDIDTFSDATRIREAVLQESIARATVSIWPAADNNERHSLLSHRQFAQDERSSAIVSAPLRTEAGELIGAIAATFADVDEAKRALSFLFASERGLASAVQSTSRATRSWLGEAGATCRRIASSGKSRVTAAVCGIVAAAMFIPMDYRVACQSELQPVSRRFVAAPFDAPLKECLVEPGDIVESNQLLAVLDGRELRWELSGIRADLARATKEHNTHLSAKEFGEAAIARHEIDRLQNQSALLEQRSANLEIRSPIAGVVVAGDLKETEGVPLETGQSLFEVAPLDRMVVEVAIGEDDIPHVQPGMSLELRLDAMPSEAVMATVQRIHPRAELREHDNVFIADAEIPNADGRLRPGMRGDAKVSTGTRFLGWNLFHKPVAALLGWLGW